MENIYAALLLHKLGKEVNEEGIKNIVTAAGAEVDESKIKSLVTSLKDVDIDKELESASLVAAAPVSGEATKEDVIKEFEHKKIKVNQYIKELGTTLGQELLKPTKIYVKSLMSIFSYYKRKKPISAIAHITGGGIVGNLPRVMPKRKSPMIRRWLNVTSKSKPVKKIPRS